MHLHEFAIGDKIRLVHFGSTQANYRRRLLSLGLTRGTELTLIRKAPLGCPIQVEIRGTALTLRTEEAALLEWEPI